MSKEIEHPAKAADTNVTNDSTPNVYKNAAEAQAGTDDAINNIKLWTKAEDDARYARATQGISPELLRSK